MLILKKSSWVVRLMTQYYRLLFLRVMMCVLSYLFWSNCFMSFVFRVCRKTALVFTHTYIRPRTGIFSLSLFPSLLLTQNVVQLQLVPLQEKPPKHTQLGNNSNQSQSHHHLFIIIIIQLISMCNSILGCFNQVFLFPPTICLVTRLTRLWYNKLG